MKITQIEKWKVVVPAREGVLARSGDWYDPALSHFDEIHKWIIRIHTDNGLCGIGESGRGEREAAIDSGIEALVGKDPRTFQLSTLPLPPGSDYLTFEMAILDLLGKHWEVPVYQLLGGARQEKVAVDYWCSRLPPEETGRRAKLGQDQGFTSIKIKAKLEDPTVERVAAIADACGPDFAITIDPNLRFHRPAEAVRMARLLEPYNVLVFEDPIPWRNRLAWYQLLRGKIDQAVAIHVATPDAVINAIKAECVDAMNVNGSMFEFVKMAYICESEGIPIWKGSGVDCGIRDMSYVHMAAATASCTFPSDIVGNFLREDDLIAEPIRIENGFAALPQSPGLGVELDEAAVARYTVSD